MYIQDMFSGSRSPMGMIPFLLLFLGNFNFLQAQIDNTGCVADDFGIDAGLYAGTIESGDGTPAFNSDDWFAGTLGRGIISTANSSAIATLLSSFNNPTFEARMNGGIFSIVDNRIWVDAVYAKDHFGGVGALDTTAYVIASKNAQDPAVWGTGIANVLGKNDLLDVAGFMRRDGSVLTGDLWFYGLITRAEPGGSAYVDFEFYIADLTYGPTGFSSGGPQMGHTAFTFDNTGKVTKLGDVIFNVSMLNGGTQANVELRIWVSRADYDKFKASRQNLPFTFGANFDGASVTAPYGYASVIPNVYDACGLVNVAGQTPLVPPWGHKGTKSNIITTTFLEYAVTEVGLNMSTYGIDNKYIDGANLCEFPYQTFIVKSRSSEAFTAQLKDFAGPYSWAEPTVLAAAGGLLSCLNETTTLTSVPLRTDVTYSWTTVDGRIVGPSNTGSIIVDRPGTYTLNYILPTGCPATPVNVVVGYDPTKPFYVSANASGTVSCTGSSGTTQLSVTGATPPYTYSWSTGATTQNLTGLAGGTYSVTVTDQVGCTKTAQAIVVTATPIVINETVTNVSCKGQSNGSITLNVTGKATLSYKWSNGNLTSSISNLKAGTYTVTVTDGDGCTATKNIVVTEPNVLAASLVKVNDSDPNPAVGNGSITMTGPTGGTSPYTYAWSGPSGYTSTSKDLTALVYGSYTVTITDQNGCTLVLNAFVFEPEVCNDNIDNDGDGLTDCDDPDCTPAAPASITNPPVCVGQSINYAASQPPVTSTYLWSVPSSGTITTIPSGGYLPGTISVIWANTQGGSFCVRAVVDGCPSLPTCQNVAVSAVPDQPLQINVD